MSNWDHNMLTPIFLYTLKYNQIKASSEITGVGYTLPNVEKQIKQKQRSMWKNQKQGVFITDKSKLKINVNITEFYETVIKVRD